MPKANYSAARFFDFLSYLGAEGIQHPAVIQQWRSVAAAMLDSLDGAEKNDLRRIDIDSLGDRFVKKLCQSRNSPRPWQVQESKRLLSLAIGNFVAYVINPARYEAEQAQEWSASAHQMVAAGVSRVTGFQQALAG